MQLKSHNQHKVLLLPIIFLIAKEKINNEKLNSDNLIWKKIYFVKNYNLFITYSFLDSKRYQTTNYFLVYFDIGIRNGTYGLNNSRYLYLKADKKIEIYNNQKNQRRKILEKESCR